MSQQDAKWNDKPKNATGHTKQYQETFAKSLDIDLKKATNEELELAASHCIYKTDHKKIPGRAGKYVWNLEEYQFLKEDEVPDTVNPSLWLNAKSNYQAGLFEVLKDKIYQIRGYDLANITFVRSKTGFIVLDTGSCVEGAAAALETAEEGLHENIHDNIRAVIISHSHSDHYGGVGAFVSEETVGFAEEGKIPVIVPGGFDEECVSESVYAGTAMHRRGRYQFAFKKKPGVRSVVSAGLGLAGNASAGHRAYITPTYEIVEDKSIFIDGLEVEFQLTPGTEAPAEMNNYFPEYRAFWAAENCTGTLHNFYPIRGAKVRDSSIWSDFTIAALERYGGKTDVVFQSHHWPHWNTEEHPSAVKDYLRNNAAIYKYIHDQTLFYANQGYTPNEIAHKINIPAKLQKAWYIRPYYGTVEVNAKAVYQRYLGYYNGNPVNLHPPTEVETARKFMEYAGSAEAVLEKAQKDFDQGDYQWAATAANYVVYAEPENRKARYLCADALEQLGYQAESSIWRNAYLIGAEELRHGVPEGPEKKQEASDENLQNNILNQASARLVLGYLGIAIDGEKAADEDFRFRLQITDGSKITESFILHLYAGTLLIYDERNEGNRGKVNVDHVKESGNIDDHANEHEENKNEIKEDHYVKGPAGFVTALVQKRLDDFRGQIETNCYDQLKRIESYIVDLSQYEQFHLVDR